MANPLPLVVLFDGDCSMCSAWVTFLIPRDTRDRIRFAALQSEAGQSILKNHRLPTANFATVTVIQGGQVFLRSDAVIRVLGELGLGWQICGKFLSLIPLLFRDGAYQIVAKNRFRWFKKRSTCFLPSAENRHRFL